MTYASLESFRNSAGIQSLFIHYMQTTERMPIAAIAEHCYTHIVVGKKSKKPSSEIKEIAPDKSATSRISFNLLINPQARQQYPQAYYETRTLIKQLMHDLYAKQKFFKEAVEKHPNFLDELLDEVQTATEKLPPDAQLHSAVELSKLQLSTPFLQYNFYLMLHGLPKLEALPIDPTENKISLESNEDEDDEAEAKNESEEAHANAGYASLLDYITVKPTSMKIRVYLASKVALQAIFEDQNVVDQIIETRREIYREVRKGENTTIATNQFKSAFAHSGQPYADLLDFTVTKTNPIPYE